MSIIRDFVTKLPAACGVPAGLAEIYGELNGKLFDFELANPDGPLNRKNFESLFDRLDLGFSPWTNFVEEKNWNTVRHARDLLTFAVRNIDASGGDFLHKASLRKRLEEDAGKPENAPVAALMTVEQASTLGNWA